MINLIAILSFILLALSGCNKPDPNPHLADFIYQDIKLKLSNAEQLKATYQSTYEELLSKVKNIDLQSREHWLLSKKSLEAKWETEKAQQKVNYYKMLLFEREKFVRQSYLKAFTKNEKWDNSEELQQYKKAIAWEASLKHNSKADKNATKSSKQLENGESEGEASEPKSNRSH